VIRATVLGAALCLAPLVAQADAAFERLYNVLKVDRYVEITRSEGLEDLDSLAQDFTGQPATAQLSEQMHKIYAPERMRETIRAALETGLSEDQITALLIVLDSDLGERALELEVAARVAMGNTDIEDAAKQAWFEAEEERPWLAARVGEMIEINDLLERNVAGALNSNFRFYQGLADGGGIELSEDDMLNQVWSQEPEIRTTSADWIGAYLHLAYEPLSEDDLETYIAFWNTTPGRALNAAIFAGFNTLYDDISYATGRVLALNMGTQEL